jgi:hypothetical protein
MPQIFKLKWPKFGFIAASSSYVVALQFMTQNTLSAVLIASITEAFNIYSLSPMPWNVIVGIRNHCIAPSYKHTAAHTYYNPSTTYNAIKLLFALSNCKTMINQYYTT